MERLIRPVRRVRPEPVARQPEARLHHLGPARRAARPGHPWADVEPDDLPEGDPGLGRLRRAVPASSPSTTARSIDDYWALVLQDINGALRRVRPGVRVGRRRRRLRERRGRPRPRPRQRRHRGRRPRPAPAHRPAQPDGEDPGHRRRRRADPGDDRRGPQHQRHVDLQPRPLPGGDGGVHRRARGVRGHRRRRPVEGGERGAASSSRVSTPRSIAGSRPSAPRRRSRCAARRRVAQAQAGLPGVRGDVLRAALGGARRPRRPGAAPAVGEHVHEEPRLPRHALRRQPDRAAHGQHAARRHDRGVRRPRHAGAHRRRRTSTRRRPTGRRWRGRRRRRRRRATRSSARA